MKNQTLRLLLIVVSFLFVLAFYGLSVTYSKNTKLITAIQVSELNSDSYMKIGKGLIRKAQYSPDEKILAVSTTTNLLLYSTTNYNVIKQYPENFVENLEWSPDSSKIAYSSGANIKILDLTNGNLTLCEDSDRMVVGDEISWAPNGKLLASSDATDANGVIYLWDTATGKITQKVVYPEKKVFGRYTYANGVAWSPDGKFLSVPYGFTNISASDKPSNMVVWDLSDQAPKVYKQWIIPTILLNGVEWTPDGKYIISGGDPIIIFSTEDGSIINQLDAPYSGRFAISSDGTQLFVPASVATANSPYGKLIVPLGKTDTSVSAYTIPELVKIHDFKGRIYSPETVDISPSGNYLMAGDGMSDGFEVWETQSQEIVNSVYLGSHWNDDLEFSPNSEMFAALGRDNKVRLYNSDTGALIETIDGLYPGFIEEVYWSSDGKAIAWQGEENDARRYYQFWDMKTNNKELGEDGVRSILKIGALQNQKKVATITRGSLLVWTLDENNGYSKTASTTINNFEFYVRCIDWSPNYEKLVVCNKDAETEKMFLEIFNPQLQTVNVIEEKRDVSYYILGWSPDGRWLATIDSKLSKHGAFLTVRAADSLEVRFIYEIESVNDILVWSPDSKWLITISSPDQYGLTIYPVDGKGNPLQIIEGTGRIDSVDWSPDGKYIVVSGANGIIYLYNAEKILEKYFPL